MPRRDIEDEVCIRILTPGSGGELERRWWAISQPPPSVAFALQASIAAALGGAADQAIRLLLRAVDPETEEEVEAEGGLRPDVAAMTDEMVVEVLQTEISGRAEAEDRPFGEVLAELSQQPDGTALTNVRGMQKNVDLARATLSALYDAQDGGGE